MRQIVGSASEDYYFSPTALPASGSVERALQRFEISLESALAGINIVARAADAQETIEGTSEDTSFSQEGREK